jgi:hypothetical protein
VNEEFEGAVSAALHEHDAGAVDVTALRLGSIARARTIRRRRVGLTGVAAAIAIVSGGTALSLASAPAPVQFGGGGAYDPSPAPGPVTPKIPTLPRAEARGAAVRPDLVGHEPGTLHFDVDTQALGVDAVSYYTGHGYEEASLGNSNVFNTWYTLGPDRAALLPHNTLNTDVTTMPEHPLIFGRPATLEKYGRGLHGDGVAWRISWQPVDGLWVVISVDDPDQARAIKAAMALKLNVSQRCVAPMHLTSLPAGYTWTGCGISVGTRLPWENSDVELSKAGGGTVLISVGNVTPVDTIVPNTTVAGRPAQWVQEPGQPANLVVPIRGWVNVNVGGGPDGPALTQAAAIDLAQRVQVGNEFTNPLAWPVKPVG